MNRDDFTHYAIVITFCAAFLASIIALLIGLWFEKVDNDKIFPLLGHAFDIILGCFAGYIGRGSDGRQKRE